MKWLPDENFRRSIIRCVLRRFPSFDIVRAQDVPEINGCSDLILLEWATAQGRVVVTQDLSTMVPAMFEQLQLESQCTPIVFVPEWMPIGEAVEELLVLDQCSTDGDG